MCIIYFRLFIFGLVIVDVICLITWDADPHVHE